MKTDIQKAHVCITGGSGFIGSNLARELHKRGTPVRILDLVPPPGDLLETCDYRACDIREPACLLGVFHDTTHVVHLASELALGCRRHPGHGWHTNSLGTLHVLNAILEQNPSVRLIFASTAAVYSDAQTEYPICEDARLLPREAYSAGKLASEGLIRSASHAWGLAAVIFRFFTVYGRGCSSKRGHFIGTWVDQIKSGAPLAIHGDGLQTLDLTEVSDVVRAFILAIETDMQIGQTLCINIATGRETSVQEVARIFKSVIPTAAFVCDTRKATAQMRLVASTRRAETVLGFSALIHAEEGLVNHLKAEFPEVG